MLFLKMIGLLFMCFALWLIFVIAKYDLLIRLRKRCPMCGSRRFEDFGGANAKLKHGWKTVSYLLCEQCGRFWMIEGGTVRREQVGRLIVCAQPIERRLQEELVTRRAGKKI